MATPVGTHETAEPLALGRRAPPPLRIRSIHGIDVGCSRTTMTTDCAEAVTVPASRSSTTAVMRRGTMFLGEPPGVGADRVDPVAS
jgi:hypothetical protein